MFKKLLAFTCLTLSVGANAAPLTWTYDNVAYEDGSTTVGSFTFDADSGIYSGLDFVTTCCTVCAGTLNRTSLGGISTFLGTGNQDDNDESVFNDFRSIDELTNAGGTVALQDTTEINSQSLGVHPSVAFSGSIPAVPAPVPAAA